MANSFSFTTFCLTILLVSGCAKPVSPILAGETFHRFRNFKTKEAPNSPIQFEPNKPFEFVFGSGGFFSGGTSLIIRIQTNGHSILQKRIFKSGIPFSVNGKSQWNQTELVLSPEAVRRLGNAIQKIRFTKLKDGYEATNIYDGGFWDFTLRQNGLEKSVFFKNYYPKSIRQFHTLLETEIEEAKRSGSLKSERVVELD